MAITAQNTSISAGSAAAAGITAQTALRDALVAHSSGAWTIEDEFDSSGAAVHWVVLKCATAISGVGFDFRVVIGRLVSTGAICVLVGETYVIGTKTLSVFAPATTSSTANILADGSFSGASTTAVATYVLGTTLPGNSANGPVGVSIAQAATERLATFVEKDYAILSVNGTFMYVGALTDLIIPITGLTAAVPVGCMQLDQVNPGGQGFGGLTRHPIAAADAPMAIPYSHALLPFMVSPNYMPVVSGNPNAVLGATYGYKDRFQNNRVSASEILATMYAPFYGNNANSRADKTGALRGKFKGIRWTTIPTAAVVYDTILVDAKKSVIAVVQSGSLSTPFVVPSTQLAKPGIVIDTGAP